MDGDDDDGTVMVVVMVLMVMVVMKADDGGDSWGAWQSFTPSQITARDLPLFKVFARDDDEGMNGELTHSLRTGRGATRRGRFKIHPSTGQVYTSVPLTAGATFNLMVEGDADGVFSMGVDTGLVSLARKLDHQHQHQQHQHRQQHHYLLTVSATDGVHTTSTKLEVSVTSTRERRPMFSSRVYNGRVSEAAVPGSTTVLTLQCRDADQQPPSPVYFTIHHPHHLASHDLFSLDSSSGELKVAQPLDREVMGEHEMTVRCREQGLIEHGGDLARVKVVVTDTNDHDPTFLHTSITATVDMGASAGSMVTRVLAIDHDTGDNGRLSYSIVEGK
ncbi:hypothetical protein Pcinc_042505 [Petrolisthes cinctipes]|uniref:Cadherin domain-containing protein n=1 Tax=Petrolisthes cinctipes TaxID=88211 RepID=A0AAE1EFX7_PETCI|nr:hypothetical protein Pcinc_042505 [Petrolisthes cinctipes]